MGKILRKFLEKFHLKRCSKKESNFLEYFTISVLTAWLRDTVSVIIHSLMLRVLNTLNGLNAVSPER
jgi:hypothetical protein